MNNIVQLAIALIEKSTGKKTYTLSGLLVILAVCDLLGLLPSEGREAIYVAALAGVAASLRHALTTNSTINQLAQGLEGSQEILDSLDSPEQPPKEPPTKGFYALLPFLVMSCCLAGCLPESQARTNIEKPAETAQVKATRDAAGNTLFEWSIRFEELRPHVNPQPVGPQPAKPDPVKPAGPQPPPVPPGPTPPEPDKPLPPDRFAIRDKLAAAARLVNPQERATRCPQLATSAEDVAEKIRKGTLTTPNAVLQIMVGELAALPAEWQPLKSAAKTEIQRVYMDGLLKTMTDWADFCDTVAAAFRAAV
ncbi:hypothetical protein Plim_2122 [Planctopirus limnophila DSM 3776]|uniref:Uncharacterized protein n=1 Tax=Planctopirus limnophila (strain ATCC 43296 / DSM 3776 / IFAM 1008 / Mu 290) TaxID=521674 RepID=D5SMP4_PLAL2|nr:hypothetical protein [Planctopirus limnophila]ADG67949.1 hypothetical protein Plim_2122 [Planctopirus limnophila DSM 3776]